jgi:dTDP-4-dehydrorhamnose reductase
MPSDKKRVLITGAKGQLGQELAAVFKKDCSVISTDNDTLDITDPVTVNKVISREKPDWIIHCAAWTNVDAAAENPKAAMKVNVGGTENICKAAKKIGAKVIYISTNEVFDGEKQTPYTEEDKTNPINPYGESKLKGEKCCQEILGDGCVIVRSSWLYGPASKTNFPNKIIEKAKEQGYLKVVDDEVATPTHTRDLAKGIKKLVEKKVGGIFHLINEGEASRLEWAKAVLKTSNLKVPIEPIKLDDFQRVSKPPKHSVLANTKAKKLGVVLRDWKLANKEYLQKI